MSTASAMEPDPAGPAADEKTYAGLAHALMIVTWWIGPLIIYLMKKDSRFVRFHALQALLWQIAYTAVYIAGFAVVFVVMFATIPFHQQRASTPPAAFSTALFLGFAAFWLYAMAGYVMTMVLAIVFAIKAMRGEWTSYPVVGRLARRMAGL